MLKKRKGWSKKDGADLSKRVSKAVAINCRIAAYVSVARAERNNFGKMLHGFRGDDAAPRRQHLAWLDVRVQGGMLVVAG